MSIIQNENQNDNENLKSKNIQFTGRVYKDSLEPLGFDKWFREKSLSILKENFNIARIVEVNKNNYKISDGKNEVNAELTGKYVFSTNRNTDFPTIGDWTVVQYFDDYSFAVIHDILQRKSLLRRKDSGKGVEFQLIAANIDYALIVQSADSNFNLNRLERYLVMAHESNVRPIVVLSKTDLNSSVDISGIKKSVKRLNNKYAFLPVSNATGSGIIALLDELKPGKTYCLLGSSGVGKTTLLNTLLGEQRYDVNSVREKDNKGRHTTSRRQLILLKNGSIFIDTPGMRELGNFAVENGLTVTFDDIVSFSDHCRFKDCSHTHESGCAVIEAVKEGIIDEQRYKNFLKIRKESAFYEMSYWEKRQRDKAFGKMYKNIMKSMRKK